jgi:hypothetical protein
MLVVEFVETSCSIMWSLQVSEKMGALGNAEALAESLDASQRIKTDLQRRQVSSSLSAICHIHLASLHSYSFLLWRC